jgi:RimJ/RimL family protein N-acetyltransferase
MQRSSQRDGRAMKFFDFEWESRRGCVRELADPDLPALVRYWHESPPEYLESMGVDLRKLASPAATEARFRDALPGALGPQRHVALAIDVLDRFVAYTNAYLDDRRVGHAHVHVLDPALRRRGLGSQLFRRVLGLYFEHFRVTELALQTHADNPAIERLLQSFGLQPQLVHDPDPSGMARAGLFHQYRIVADDVSKLEHPHRPC